MDILVVCSKCLGLNRVDLSRVLKSGALCGRCRASLPLTEGVQSLTDSTLGPLVQKSLRPVVIDFWAPWCGPCKVFAPIFQQAAKEWGGKIVFAKLNTEENAHGSQQFGIRSIPTLIVFKSGKEVDRQSGAMGLETLVDYLKRFA